VEVFVLFLSGFAFGWGSVWIIRTMELMKEESKEKIDYNIIEKSLKDFVDSPYDPENYFNQGKAEGTK
jgi:hypothetical protein